MLVQLYHRYLLLGWPYIYKYARVDACQKPGRGWQCNDTKDLIVLLGDSRGLHGRWPGNGYSYRRVRVETHTRFVVPREFILETFVLVNN